MLTWKSAVSRIIVETDETGADLNRVSGGLFLEIYWIKISPPMHN